MQKKGKDPEERNEAFYKPKYTIGAAARILKISVPTLRLYESEGLILTFKTDSKRRLYSDLEIEKIKCIMKMIREQGLNFEGIKNLFALIPCWFIKRCSEEERARCTPYLERKVPCWASEEKCPNPLPDCRECEIYRKFSKYSDLRISITDLMKS